ILYHADMPGFSQHEQERLARLVLSHRGKLGKLQLPAQSEDWELILCLRLAILFNRSRTAMRFPEIGCTTSSKGFRISLPEGWTEAYPLTAAALEGEAEGWRNIGFRLEVDTYEAQAQSSAS